MVARLVPRARGSVRNTPRPSGRRRALAAIGSALTVAACGHAPQPAQPSQPDVMLVQTSIVLPPPPEPVAPAPPVEPLSIGSAAVDTTGGWLPDGTTLSPFDTANPILSQMNPALLRAVQDATRAAQPAGVDIRITSGWRSPGFQQRLFDDAVRSYGSVAAAAQFVATPEVSQHVRGQAVDIGPTAADQWMIANGKQFGLCQIYANEIWHFELALDAAGNCPPLRPNAAG
ncbi:M15 family metallopeptidase [Mycolicibacterium sp. 3033]|nr:M15 family metallopeptidase [Mycolicibacterium aurantiacum]